jgi:hypothetical protein
VSVIRRRIGPLWRAFYFEDFVYYESRKRELQITLMNEGRCDERLIARVEESTCLTYTGWVARQNKLEIPTLLFIMNE